MAYSNAHRLSLSVGLAAGVAVAVSQPLRGDSDPAVNPPAPLLAPAPDATPLRIFVTADARGYIEPCGCATGQFGGLPRRGTLFAVARRPHDIAIDLGNFAAGERPLDRLRLRYMLGGFDALRYDVLVPGEGELALGADFEKAATALKSPVVLCANLLRACDGKPVFAPSVIKVLPSGKRVGIIGLTSPFQAVPSQYRVAPLEATLRENLAALVGKADAVIVAGFLDGKPALDLAVAFPKVTLVLGGRVPKGSPDLLRRGGAPVMLVGELAQYVAWVDLGEDFSATAGGQAWLPDSVADDPKLAALVDRHRAEATAMGPEFAREALATFRAEGRIGSAACNECHSKEHASWLASAHARAMEGLKAKGEEKNAACLKCHLQDLPAASNDAGADLVLGVGCESCHGPGHRHVEAVRSDGPTVSLKLMDRDVAMSCGRCHDHVNSPKFDLNTYGARVRHGPDAREGTR